MSEDISRNEELPEDSIKDEEIVEQNHFEDDEMMLSGDDQVLYDNDEKSAFAQMDGVIVWEIEGLYNSKGVPKNKYAMRDNPPVLTVRSSANDDMASFILTKEFVNSLNSQLDVAHNAYYGVKNKKSNSGEKKTSKEQLDNSVQWVKDNPFKTVLVAVIVLLFIYFGFIVG